MLTTLYNVFLMRMHWQWLIKPIQKFMSTLPTLDNYGKTRMCTVRTFVTAIYAINLFLKYIQFEKEMCPRVFTFSIKFYSVRIFIFIVIILSIYTFKLLEQNRSNLDKFVSAEGWYGKIMKMRFRYSNTQWRIQDFPQVGAWTLHEGCDFAKFSQKLHEIERIWTPRGGGVRPSRPPP